MTNANSFRSAIFVLLLFGAVYFIALGIYELKKLIVKRVKQRKASADRPQTSGTDRQE